MRNPRICDLGPSSITRPAASPSVPSPIKDQRQLPNLSYSSLTHSHMLDNQTECTHVHVLSMHVHLLALLAYPLPIPHRCQVAICQASPANPSSNPRLGGVILISMNILDSGVALIVLLLRYPYGGFGKMCVILWGIKKSDDG